jgi:hypothetical protein
MLMPISASRLARARRVLRTAYPASYVLALPPAAIVALADLMHAPDPAEAAARPRSAKD